MTYVFKESDPISEDVGKDLGPWCLLRFLSFCYLENKSNPIINYLGDIKKTKKRNELGYLDEKEQS